MWDLVYWQLIRQCHIKRNSYEIGILTYRPTARQRLGKHTPAETNTRNNRTPIARQRISKHMSLTIEAVFSAWSVQSGYKEGFSWEKIVVRSWDSSAEDEFIWVSCCRVLATAVEDDWEEMTRNELDSAKKTSCVKSQWDCYISVVRIRLLKTENPSACVSENCKVCKSAIAL
jgi:hypothetical protein